MKANLTDLSSLNELQHEAVVSEELRLLVLAGAGSGKTKTLLQKLIYLIEERGVSPAHILAITFTKNAANEMIDRLIITAEGNNHYEEILANKNLSFIDKNRQRLIHQKKHKWIEGLSVKTFHSFCYQVLRSYGVNEFDNKFKIIGPEKADEEEETAKFAAPETVYEVIHKLLIECCEEQSFFIAT
jgi:DNA helicase-4